MKTFGVIDQSLLQSIGKLVGQNAELRQQVIEQQKIINDIKLHDISKDVTRHIKQWMDRPYESNKSELQDIKDFSFKITKYIDYRIRI